jgi:hypothetical protein
LAKRLLTIHNYKGLISVSHPFTGHLVGLAVKSKSPLISWIADVGDPFCFLNETPTNNHKLYSSLNYHYDRKVFNNANAITVTVESTLETYAALFPESAAKIHVIPPLISVSAHSCSEESIFPRAEKIRLVYTGTLYRKVRDPLFLLKLFDKLLLSDIGSDIELHFFGAIHDCYDCFMPYRALLGNKIFLHSRVNHETAFRAVKEASLLVNIGNNTPYQLPSKLVEYACTGKPVLNLVKTDKDSSIKFWRSYPAALCLFEDEAMLNSNRIDEVVSFIKNSRCVEPSTLQHWLAAFQIDSIASSYERLLS